MTGWTLDPVGGWWLVAAAALVLAPLLAVGPGRDRQSRSRRWALVGMRALTLLLLLALMLRPALETRTTRKLPGTLIVLADSSRSMEVEDAVLNQSRHGAMRAALDAAAPELAELAETWDIHGYAFGQDIEEVEFVDGEFQLAERPEGAQTAIGAAIEDVLAREAQQRIVAVVLLSDGAQRAFAPRDEPPQTAVRRLAADGIPLYTIAFGQPSLGLQADLRMSDLLAGDAVFAETPATIEGLVTAAGYSNREFKVQLLWETTDDEMAAVDTRVIKILPRQRRYPVQLTHTPRVPGEYKVTLLVESPEGELVTTNNAQSTFVTVLKGGVNILYLAGADRIGGLPGVEPRFLRPALAAHSDFHVVYEAVRYAAPLDKRDQLREETFDVFLLGNVDESGLTRRSWQAMADAVEQGAGLGMLGGFHSFGPGGFQGSPLEPVLPIIMGRAERQNFGDPPAADLHVPGPLRVAPIERNGDAHPIMRIAEGAGNAALWRELPPLDGANRFHRVRLKANAEPWAEGDDGSRSPLLVLGGYGSGRTAAVAFDTTWHWQLGGKNEAQRNAHRRFWRQLVLWLAKKDETAGEQVWVRLDQRRYQQGSRVDFTLGAEDGEGQPLADATYEVRIEKPDGAVETVVVTRRGAGAAGSFADTAAPGDYRITVAARDGGESVGTATARFSVSDQDVELDQPAAEPTLLASLAGLTAEAGGAGLAPEELPDLLERLKAQAEEFEEEIVETITLWDRWPPLVAMVGLLSAEWFFRKRWGLA
jgi:uncharacterized membrane protein